MLCLAERMKTFHKRNDFQYSMMFLNESQNKVICNLSLPLSVTEGFRGHGSLPFSEEPKRIRRKSLRSRSKTE